MVNLAQTAVAPNGEEFRDCDRRLPAELVRDLNRMSDWRGLISLVEGLAGLGVFAALAVVVWGPWTVIPAVLLIATRQHALAILIHESAHYRLFADRALNDRIGTVLGWMIGVSMHSYRVVHRLHHNHLYQPIDPDIPLMAGYPRGRAYLLKKLLKDLTGITAYKNYAYFFGAPGKNRDTGQAPRPLDDTSPRLRQRARRDRLAVLAFHGIILLAVALTGWWPQALVLWYLPLFTVLQVILRIRALMEHGAVSDTRSPLLAARTNLCPAWLAWTLFPHNVNYHIEHHLYPAIPHYNLPRAHREMMASGLLEGAEVRTVREAAAMIFADPQPDLAN